MVTCTSYNGIYTYIYIYIPAINYYSILQIWDVSLTGECSVVHTVSRACLHKINIVCQCQTFLKVVSTS